MSRCGSVVLALLCLAAPLGADESLKGRACRSVHLAYAGPEGQAFYNEVSVERSAPGTYFCVCGFSKGYFGIQELTNGKKLAIFSVWDPGAQNDPKQVAEQRRTKLLHQGQGVRVGRFGNEGTGGQSFFDFDWEPGATYRFLVTAAPDGAERTAYAGYLHLPKDKSWHHLVTFSTLTGGVRLKGYYSFVEDFQRNGVSATKERKAYYSNAWAQTPKGEWLPLAKASFTADANPVTNIDAGLDRGRFFLATGGTTENVTTKLRALLPEPPAAPPPSDLPMR
jgi:hypothetical protein